MRDIPFTVENGWPKYTHHYSKSKYPIIYPPFNFNDYIGCEEFAVYYNYPYYVHVKEFEGTFTVTTNFKIVTKEETNGLRIIYPFPNEDKIKID